MWGNRLCWPIALLLAVSLTGCLGSSSSSSSSNNDNGNDDDGNDTALSGTVAAGAPLIGFVAAKDSEDNVVSAEVDGDGSYSLDVADLEPPYLLYASGISGGTAYVILSAATEEDTGGTVNVTPLTDLIVANVAGSNPTALFNDPDFDMFTRTALDTQEDVLRKRLAHLFEAAEMDAEEFNLLSVAFKADRTGFDAVLDMLEIAVEGDVATITNRLTQESITDDLTDPTDAEALVVADAGALKAAIAANQAIDEWAAGMAALSLDVPLTSAELDEFVTADFLTNGCDRGCLDEFAAAEDSADQEELKEFLSGFRNYALRELNLNESPQIATIDTGEPFSWTLEDHGSGWKLAGNGQHWEAEVSTEHHRHIGTGGANDPRSELNFEVEYEDAGDGDYITVTGPGLGDDVTLKQYFLSDEENEETPGEFFKGVTLTDDEIDAIPNGAVYTFTRYDDEDVAHEAYTGRLMVRPIKSDESIAVPTIGTPTPTEVKAFTDGDLTVEWTLPLGYATHSVVLDRFYSDTGEQQRAAEERPASGATKVVLADVPPPESGDLDWQNVMVFTHDVFGRTVAVTHGATY